MLTAAMEGVVGIAFPARVGMGDVEVTASLEEEVMVVMGAIASKVLVGMVGTGVTVLAEEEKEVRVAVGLKEMEQMETMETRDNRD
ncbi:MAG: hypothetical protein KBC64_05455 [Simkaniaceae bacterium]|nr:hypothetical protein [Simkaniaceae bacterium]